MQLVYLYYSEALLDDSRKVFWMFFKTMKSSGNIYEKAIISLIYSSLYFSITLFISSNLTILLSNSFPISADAITNLI